MVVPVSQPRGGMREENLPPPDPRVARQGRISHLAAPAPMEAPVPLRPASRSITLRDGRAIKAAWKAVQLPDGRLLREARRIAESFDESKAVERES